MIPQRLMVSDAAIRLHVAFHGALKVMQPYIHLLLHCGDWEHYDVPERSAEQQRRWSTSIRL